MKKVTRKVAMLKGGQGVTAREIMEALMKEGDKEEKCKPRVRERAHEEAPLKPNAFSDGSLTNTKGHFWQLGGAGVWRPIREICDLTKEEQDVAEFKKH